MWPVSHSGRPEEGKSWLGLGGGPDGAALLGGGEGQQWAGKEAGRAREVLEEGGDQARSGVRESGA